MNHRFDRNGWKYGKSRIEDLAETVRSYAPNAVIHTDRGGKAFGLGLCEILARDVFLVPNWIAVTPDHPLTIDPQTLFSSAVFVRSNTLDEDWMDQRSGLQESALGHFSHNFQEVFDRLMGECGGVVLQRYCKKQVGMVIDLAWSEILERNILKVAIGVPTTDGSGRSFTSPTWDNEALVGVFDAQTGEPIMNLKPWWVDVERVIKKMLTVVPRLIELHIDFGLQLELMADTRDNIESMQSLIPDYTPIDNLLQVRPSPELVRGTYLPPHKNGTLQEMSARVNLCGRVCAEVFVIKRGASSARGSDLGQDIHSAGRYTENMRGFAFLSPDITQKILFWDANTLYKYGESFHQINGGWKLGAVAQISRSPLLINSAHGMSANMRKIGSPEHKSALHSALCGGLLITIGDTFKSTLRQLLRTHDEPLELEMVCDGLVSQIFLC